MPRSHFAAPSPGRGTLPPLGRKMALFRPICPGRAGGDDIFTWKMALPLNQSFACSFHYGHGVTYKNIVTPHHQLKLALEFGSPHNSRKHPPILEFRTSLTGASISLIVGPFFIMKIKYSLSTALPKIQNLPPSPIMLVRLRVTLQEVDDKDRQDNCIFSWL